MLGEPLIKVNLTDQMIDRCIDDAIQAFTIYHYEGVRHTFYPQIITPSILKIDSILKHKLRGGETVTGLTSRATAKVCSDYNLLDRRTQSIGNQIAVHRTRGEFIPGETITIADTPPYHDDHDKPSPQQYKLIDTNDAWTKGIIDEHKIKMPDWIVGIRQILPSSQALSSQNLFDLQYQLRLNDFTATQITTQSLVYFEQAMEHIDLLNYELNAKPDFDFSFYDGYLYPITNWDYDFCVGDIMIIEGYRSQNFEGQSKVWNEVWLKQYAVALAKRLWGSVLKKYQNVQLPGGVTMNGDQIYQEAQTEIDKLENQLQSLSWPSAFMIG